VLDAKVDSEPSTEPEHLPVDSPVAEDAVHAPIKPLGNFEDMRIKGGFPVSSNGCQRRRDHYRMPVVGAAMLAVSLWHQTRHDVRATAKHAQRITATDGLSHRA